VELAERHLEVLDDLRPFVGPADDRTQLARLVVMELDDGDRLVVVLAAVVVDLPLAVDVLDHGQTTALCGAEGVLDADAGKSRLSKVYGHVFMPPRSV
jgi:hypothetical protein